MSARDFVDPTDRRLLLLLQANARRSVADLGRELNLSRTAVHARIERLERDGVIAGYTTRFGHRETEGVSAMLSLRLGVRPCRLAMDRIMAWPEIEQGFSVAGVLDAMLVVRVGTPAALSELTDRLLAMEEVTTVEATVILDRFAGRVRRSGLV